MLQLMILRHLKTGWALPGQRDIDRKLEPRGISDGEIVSSWFRRYKLDVGHIYCSDAVRTRQTCDLIKSAFEQVEVSYESQLYSGTADDYLEMAQLHHEPGNILFIGHNPSCAALANMMLDRAKFEGSDPQLNAISYKYPTGSLSVLEFEIDHWSQLKSGSGELVHFLMPKQFRTHP